MREVGVSYRQLRSLRSLASGYDCIALRANYKDHAGRGTRRDFNCGGNRFEENRQGGQHHEEEDVNV